MLVKRIAPAVAALAILLAAAGMRSAAQQGATVTVQLLAINDFHGTLEPPTGADGRFGQTPVGGAEYLATFLQFGL